MRTTTSKRLFSLLTVLALVIAMVPVFSASADGNTDSILTERRLTDEEIAGLWGQNPEVIQAQISTFADCRAFLDMKFPELWHDAGLFHYDNDPIGEYVGAEDYILSFDSSGQSWRAFGRCDMTTIATYLLKDDMDICGIYALLYDEPTQAICCINTGSGYIFADIVKGMQAEDGCTYAYVPPLSEGTYSTISEYIDSELSDRNFDTICMCKEGMGLQKLTKNGFCNVVTSVDQFSYCEYYNNYDNDVYNGWHYPYAYTGNGIQWDDSLLTERLLTDEEVESLWNKDAEDAKNEISTLPDALAFINVKIVTLQRGNFIDDGISPNQIRDGLFFIVSPPDVCDYICGQADLATIVTYLLSDNMDICSLYAVGSSETMAINCINTGSQWIFIDMAKAKRGQRKAPGDYGLPEMTCSSISEYMDFIFSPKYTGTPFDAACIDDSGDFYIAQLYHEDSNGKKRISIDLKYVEPPTILWQNSSKMLTDEEYHEKMYGHVKPENINKYQLSGMLGGVTLTPEEAYALVDAAPEIVQEKVKTAADVLMYMLAANIQDCHGDKTMMVGNDQWHYNMTANQVMETRTANCGSSANLARYLLDGDYEEVGIIEQAYYPGEGGGHVYTYIKDNGKYFIIDYSWYIFANYATTNDFPAFSVGNLNSLDEFAPLAETLYGPVNIIVSTSSVLNDTPCIFGDEMYGTDHPEYVLPAGVDYNIIKEDNNGYTFATKELDVKNHPELDYTVFWR